MNFQSFMYAFVAVVFAALIAYTVTPPVRVLAFKIGAIDVPKDGRRMHSKPIPRLGGLAIYAAFLFSTVVFGSFGKELLVLLFGGFIIVLLGMFDDIFRLNAWLKFAVQLAVSVGAVSQGILIDRINIFGTYIEFGWLSYPITVLWITGMTNAINLIDGLDGLACGVSAICSASTCIVALLMGDFDAALITALLSSSCVGFLPFNSNPARIFMGDSGALFLGYSLAILSVNDLFKLHTVISFVLPAMIFALPLFEVSSSFIRRILKGQSPFSADRSHLHHKLIDWGYSQKQAVNIMYSICALFGMIGIAFTDVLFEDDRYIKAVMIIGSALLVFILNYFVIVKPKARGLSGLLADDEKNDEPENLRDR